MKHLFTPLLILAAGLIALPGVFAQAQSDVTSSTVVTSRPTPTPSPQEAEVDYFLKIPDVEGESENAEPSSTPDEVMTHPEEGVEPEEIDYDGDSDLEGIEPDEIDNANTSENATNFGILLSGGDNDSDEARDKRRNAADIIFEGVQEADDVPMETLSLNYGEVKTTIPHNVKLFGFIPVSTNAAVTIDNEGHVKVRFPWWAFLASGKDDSLGQRVSQVISNVLETRQHEIGHALGTE